MTTRCLLSLALFVPPCALLAAAPDAANAGRRAPPPGLVIPAAGRAELERGAVQLGQMIEEIRTRSKDKPAALDLLPDVEVYHKAVAWPLRYDEFLRTNDVALARTLLRQGLARAEALRESQAPWTTATGLVVRGYVSQIDGSIQPYGLVVPASFRPNSAHRHRLDVWLHGRDNNLTELKFISDRQRSAGEFTPADAIVLHPYGRYCNAFKFAGEVDVLEALEHARRHYPVDENRIAMRGFSMGGAGCWHLAAHHAGLWAAAAPGAGFAETADYTKALSRDPKPAWYEQQLWHLYDATDYAANLFNCPVVAYSGELDKQKQAADLMGKALALEGLELTHLIGPKTEHRYHPETKVEVTSRVDVIVERGRDPVPRKVRLSTWTLRYNQMSWVTVDGLGQHWNQARVEAEIVSDRLVRVKTKNVSALTLAMPAGYCPLDLTIEPEVEIDGQKAKAPRVLSDRSWVAQFRKDRDRWIVSGGVAHDLPNDSEILRKRHGLQGPIDDAFFERFVMVRPTGQPLTEKTGAWVAAKQARAIDHWRAQFRGEAPVKSEEEITAADIASCNLVLWGDPRSNRLLAKIADKLPIRWTERSVVVGKDTYSSESHVPVLVYPNPLNPARYVVLNSGFTFGEVGHLSNALQTPKLPDYAIVNVNAGLASTLAGVVTAGFFDERWQISPAPK